VPLLRLGLPSGTFDLAWLTRLGRARADGLRLLATAWTEAYQARFEGAALASGADGGSHPRPLRLRSAPPRRPS
jgi:hypothetical protein